jgi:four helix bundle protein
MYATKADRLLAVNQKVQMTTNSTDLRERTKQFALKTVQMYACLPQTVQAQVLGKQALCSGTSIGANYREAFRVRSTDEFIAKMGDCLKEADETAYWFDLLVDSGIVSAEKWHRFKMKWVSFWQF